MNFEFNSFFIESSSVSFFYMALVTRKMPVPHSAAVPVTVVFDLSAEPDEPVGMDVETSEQLAHILQAQIIDDATRRLAEVLGT